jgi:hypothetical protein
MTCGSCQYYQSDRGIWTCTGWTGDGSRGHCLVEPSPTFRSADAQACRHYLKRKI